LIYASVYLGSQHIKMNSKIKEEKEDTKTKKKWF
jgi:hypothetical protein